jgi:hypothetical protein
MEPNRAWRMCITGPRPPIRRLDASASGSASIRRPRSVLGDVAPEWGAGARCGLRGAARGESPNPQASSGRGGSGPCRAVRRARSDRWARRSCRIRPRSAPYGRVCILLEANYEHYSATSSAVSLGRPSKVLRRQGRKSLRLPLNEWVSDRMTGCCWRGCARSQRSARAGAGRRPRCGFEYVIIHVNGSATVAVDDVTTSVSPNVIVADRKLFQAWWYSDLESAQIGPG